MFGLFATGVTIVTARNVDGEPIGLTANSLSSVSLDPPLLLWCLDNRSRHLAAFSVDTAFAIHILCEQQADVALRFARSGAGKFADDSSPQRSGAPPEIGRALARIECRVSALHAAGDHTIIVGEVRSATSNDLPPLVFQGSRFGRFFCDQPHDGEEAWNQLIDMWS